ncbi:hypothetical protein AYJ08_00345 [Brevibacillus sp. SKDU10]|uniref:hypothetical protein n=1 Tax=Brevibacillus sp. SKDU10 TaxID=1247872 RepID=UPI0007C88BFF|nr:hypothetical protein [Brevibacillus sp. SKDU10]OAJ75233.1 hypothetical protein AYJ08_00345 [Brevibacillus sp. SKDU10]
MIKRPVMWAIGFEHQEDTFYNFTKGEEDTNLTFNHLVPTKDMAMDFIENYLAISYIPIPVTIISYSEDGTFVYAYDPLYEWE